MVVPLLLFGRISAIPRHIVGLCWILQIATRTLAVADKAANLYASADGGYSWLHGDAGLPMIAKVLLI